MSTEDINKVVVTLHKGVDVDAFIDEMSSIGNSSPHVPSRAVEIYNEKPESLRNVDFVMTRREMEELRKDPRVLACRYGTKKENNIEIGFSTLDDQRLYTRTSNFATGNVDMGWGIRQTLATTNQYTSSTSVNYSWPYTLTGLGVDFIIQDSGLQVNHPEFTNSNTGLSRVKQINWFTATGTSGTMPANFYTDVNGHGTNCAGIAAGKTYGWAKESDIYVMNILGENANSTIAPALSFNLIRLWHQQKIITAKGYKRPTVVNMSWGYGVPMNFVVGGNYRGTNWSGSAPQPSYGIVDNGQYRMPYVEPSVQADADDCLDAGVILIGAAGNGSFKIDVLGGIDYDNNVRYSGEGSTPFYYMRGSTPCANPDVISVGAVALQNSPEIKAYFSCTGPGVPVYVAGDYVVGPCSNTNNLGPYPIVNYPFDSSFRSAKVSGTSQAAPQVAGLVCCLLQSRPWYDMGRIKNWINDTAISNRLTDTGGSYSDYTSLQGGPNKYLYNPFMGTEPTVITHTAPAKIDENPNYTAELHGKF